MNVENTYLSTVWAAAALCYQGRERSLRPSDFDERGFAPTTELIRYYLAALSKAGLATPVVGRPRPLSDRYSYVLENIDIDTRQTTISNRLESIRQHLNQPGVQLAIREVITECLGSECQKYARFYGAKEGYSVIAGALPSQPLKYMLTVWSVGQVFMLLWRTIKEFGKKQHQKNDALLFDDIVTQAQRHGLHYQRLGKPITPYNPPNHLGVSVLRQTIFTLLLELPLDNALLVGPQAYIQKSLDTLPILNCSNDG